MVMCAVCCLRPRVLTHLTSPAHICSPGMVGVVGTKAGALAGERYNLDTAGVLSQYLRVAQ